MDARRVQAFQQIAWDYYAAHGRHDLPWRQPGPDEVFDPYAIMVSEIMLQQTQVPRVIPKFVAFMAQFPSVKHLAAAPLGAVLQAWSGLGYNRRAKFLWQAATRIMKEYGGRVPATRIELERLPGIGPNTAGALLTYAYNQPAIFIETNVRTVFIHHFFADQESIPDKAIVDLVILTLPDPGPGRAVTDSPKANSALPKGDDEKPALRVSHYRHWYWALMDYGTFLKQQVGNVSRASTHYTKQSVFKGSKRQIRGQVLRLISQMPMTTHELQTAVPDARLAGVLDDLEKEGLIQNNKSTYSL